VADRITDIERKRILADLQRDAEAHQRMMAEVTGNPRSAKKRSRLDGMLARERARKKKIEELKRDNAKLNLEHRIRKAESWLTTLWRVHQALCSQQLPPADWDDWDQRRKNEEEANRRTERGVQLTLKILEQEQTVKTLKRSYEHLFGEGGK
jgi:hypothetical protein